ncbi:MAG: hypothetical protein N2038_05995 [Geminicoccaceae bacterium]|nr:hypothetical protein [Geminicoccaceae bacterium]MCS7268012.1 hypothetical protein [Geminicoccaceae bacterium]MCX7629785.1 hypothetical protein [Geminicoccaceae bacterium]MDW8125772.1 hypothetical protein [Geminicoccaceae bacterium]MDW8341390.1 hypothetical protein [Geminicoccaceae bacterium]
MPSISPEPRPPSAPAALLAGAVLLGATLCSPAHASQLCELGTAIASESQLRERIRRCRKEDVVVIAVASASLPASRAAAFACDFEAQIVIEETTDAPGVARVTCRFPGEARRRR